MNKTNAVVSSYIGVVLFSSFAFLGAWSLWYWQGFLYIVCAIFGTTINHVLLPAGSNLTEERARTAKDGLAWDKKILGLTFLGSLVSFVVAGLDSGRFLWSGAFPLSLTILGVILLLSGQGIFALAKRENGFFSSTVRLQPENGHTVCTTGLYKMVRHPGYLGLIISNVGFLLVMNSYMAFIPTAIVVVLIVIRTVLEDGFLMSNLLGYKEYSARTQAKLIPGIF